MPGPPRTPWGRCSGSAARAQASASDDRGCVAAVSDASQPPPHVAGYAADEWWGKKSVVGEGLSERILNRLSSLSVQQVRMISPRSKLVVQLAQGAIAGIKSPIIATLAAAQTSWISSGTKPARTMQKRQQWKSLPHTHSFR